MIPATSRGSGRTAGRAPLLARAALTATVASVMLAGCGSGDGGGSGSANGNGTAGAQGKGGHPFAGGWRSEGGEAGGGGTRLTVNGDGSLRFQSTVDCTGSSKPTTGRTYSFSFVCGAAKFSGTADAPGGAKRFVMTWEEGDTSEFQAES